jgi:hypothetical protein
VAYQELSGGHRSSNASSPQESGIIETIPEGIYATVCRVYTSGRHAHSGSKETPEIAETEVKRWHVDRALFVPAYPEPPRNRTVTAGASHGSTFFP